MDKTKIAVAVFDKCAEIYQGKFMDVSLYHDTLDLFCDGIKMKNAVILELACGPGNITKYVLEKRPDFQILGTDLAPRMIKLAKTNNPNAVFEIMDCRNFTVLENKYDGIMCGFCLPYLSKEEAVQLIGDASKMLNKGGLLYISTMEDDYSKSEFKKGSSGDAIFMHYHQADYLTEALTAFGFQILQTKRQIYSEKEGSQTTDLILISQK